MAAKAMKSMRCDFSRCWRIASFCTLTMRSAASRATSETASLGRGLEDGGAPPKAKDSSRYTAVPADAPQSIRASQSMPSLLTPPPCRSPLLAV